MPLELGIFLGAKRYGDARQRRKSCLVLERDPYRYQVFCSDIGGQDIWPHGNKVEDVIAGVRDWLRTGGRVPRKFREGVASSNVIWRSGAICQECVEQEAWICGTSLFSTTVPWLRVG
jgi:hypothetical protein